MLKRRAAIEWNRKSFTKFDVRTRVLGRDMEMHQRDALVAVGHQVLDDCVTIPPTVPKAPVPFGGTLREMGTIRVVDSTVEIIFDTPYAAVMHAGRWETGPLAGIEVQHWSEPGSGPNYLLSKLQRRRRIYAQTYTEVLARLTGIG